MARWKVNSPPTAGRYVRETWELKIKFVAPLGEIPKEFQPAEAKKQEEKQTSTSSSDKATTDESDDERGDTRLLRNLT